MHRSFARLLAVAPSVALAAFSSSSLALAQAPSVHLGHGFQPRFFNSTRWDPDASRNVGQTKLLLNTLIEGPSDVEVLLTVEQVGHAVMGASCRTAWISDESTDAARVAELRECATDPVDATTIDASHPVDIVLASVDPRSSSRTEFFRATFPVIAFHDWDGNEGGHPVYVEQRALRLDSLYGVGTIFQGKPELTFGYTTTAPNENLPSEYAFRCRVDAGAWTEYEARLSRGNEQDLVNRVFADEYTLAEENQTIVTQFVSVDVRMPIAIRGREATSSAGTSLDGAWTCELRFVDGERTRLERQFQFRVANGYVEPHAIEARFPAGHGAALASIAFDAASLPMIVDPAIVRENLFGRRLDGVVAPVLAGLPARAVQPSLVAPRGAARPTTRPTRTRR